MSIPEGFAKTPLRLHVNGGAATIAFAAWTPLLLLSQLELSHLRIKFFCKGKWRVENTVSKWPFSSAFCPCSHAKPWFVRCPPVQASASCAAWPCSKCFPCVPWKQAQPGRMQAGELQLGPEMSLLVLTHFTDPRVSDSKIFLSCHLGPAQGFSKRDNATFHWQTGVFWHAVPCWELAHRHVPGTWAGLQDRGPYPNTGQLPGVEQLSCENWDIFGAELISWLVFVRAEAVFAFPRRLQTQLKCIKQLKIITNSTDNNRVSV